MDDGSSFNLFLHKKVEHLRCRLRWDEGSVTGDYVDLPVSEWKMINIVKGTDSITFTSNDMSVTQDIADETWSLDSTVYLFSQNQVNISEERRAKIKLYDFKLYELGELIREFVPVLDPNGDACLYDKVTNEYFYNIGEEEFGYSMHDNIYEYVESSGTQYIDIGVSADEYTQLEMVFALNDDYTTTQGIFGARSGYATNSFNMFWYDSALRWDYFNSFYYPTNNADFTKPTFITASASSVEVNLNVTSYTNSSSFSTGNNMYLFAVNNGGSPIFINSGMKVYYIKVRHNGQVIRNLIPVTDSEGIPCFYDLVAMTFIYNQNTSSTTGFTVSR